MNPFHIEIIRRGISTLKHVADPAERADLLLAASELLTGWDEDLSVKCRATAQCLKETENCQLQLFNSLT